MTKYEIVYFIYYYLPTYFIANEKYIIHTEQELHYIIYDIIGHIYRPKRSTAGTFYLKKILCSGIFQHTFFIYVHHSEKTSLAGSDIVNKICMKYLNV